MQNLLHWSHKPYPARTRLHAALALSLGLIISGTALAADDSMSVTRLDAVQVKVSTATRTERLLADVPVRTEVLHGEEIRLRGALDFSRAAELINGLRVESNCQNCNTSEAQMLGLPGAYNQLLFDGVPLLSTLGSVYGLEQIPAALVDTVEVVKGGGSSLYGPGAVAGVINLIPRQPSRGGFIRYGLDMQKSEPLHSVDGRGDFTSSDKRVGVAVVGQALRNGALDLNHDGYSEQTRRKQQVVGFQGWYSPTDATTVFFNYLFTHEDRRGGNRLEQPAWLANITEYADTHYHRGGLRLEQAVSDDVDFRVGYSFAHIKRDSFYGGLGDVVTDPHHPDFDATELDPGNPESAAATSYKQYGNTTNPLHYLDTQLNWRLGAHALAFGVQHKHEAIKDENLNATGKRLMVTSDESFTNTGIFVQDEWTVSEYTDLVLGLRADKSSSLDRVVLSPRLALAFQASPRLKLRAGISTGFRAPELFSEDLHVNTLGGSLLHIRNTSGLSEERAVTSLLGMDWRSDAAQPRWTWDATLSVTQVRDTFVLSNVQADADGTLYQTRGNASGSKVAGLESNLGWQASPGLRLSGGLAWYRARYDRAQIVFDDTADGGDTMIATRRYLKTPELSGLAQATWSPSPDWDSYIGLKYSGRMHVLNNNTGTLKHTPQFWVTDIGGTRHFHNSAGGGLDISFGIRNLFDQRQKDLEVGANRDSDYVYGPRFARAYYASLRNDF